MLPSVTLFPPAKLRVQGRGLLVGRNKTFVIKHVPGLWNVNESNTKVSRRPDARYRSVAPNVSGH